MARIALFFLFFSCFYAISSAHPPSDIKIEFNRDTKILSAQIIHNTSDPVRHYIKKADIELNGKEIIQQEISRQDNNQDQSLKYLIPDAKNADIVSVEGECSISGKLKKEITI